MTRNDTTSTIVTSLEIAWTQIREAHPDVPEAIVVMASGTTSPRKLLGHYADSRWTRKDEKGAPRIAEVLIAGEGFQRDPTDVFGTLLHEAAHGLAAARKLKDTSRGGRYHNKVFAQLAKELGLEVEKMGTFGLAHTTVPAGTVSRWKKTIDAIGEAARNHFRFAEGQGGGEEKPKSRLLKAVCGCGRKIRLSQEVFDQAAILCESCEEPFELEE